MSDQLQRDVGRHDAEIEALKADMAEVKADVKQVLSTLSEAKGGWKTLMLVAGAAGSVGALIGKFIPFFK